MAWKFKIFHNNDSNFEEKKQFQISTPEGKGFEGLEIAKNGQFHDS